MKQIVFLATYWGAKYGGINTFNFDLCKAVAQILKKENYQVVCVALETDIKAMAEAEEAGVNLIHLETGKKEFHLSILISDKINKIDFDKVVWWVGHDLHSGEFALALRNKYKGRVALINHMNCEAYESLKCPDAKERENKLEIQKDIFQKADYVFGVGPDLEGYARSFNNKSDILIPGLIEDKERYGKQEDQDLSRFKAITLGRLDSEIKQLPLSLKAFAKAHDQYKKYHDFAKRPTITVYGISEDAAIYKKLKDEYSTITVNPFPYDEDREKVWLKMRECNLCLMPSLHEGFGLAGWEAIGLETPLILTKESGIIYLLKDLRCENLVQFIEVTSNESQNIEPLSDCIMKVYNDKEDFYKENAIMLRKKLLQEGYTWEKTAQDFLEAIGIEHNGKTQSTQNSSGNQTLSTTRIDLDDPCVDDYREERRKFQPDKGDTWKNTHQHDSEPVEKQLFSMDQPCENPFVNDGLPLSSNAPSYVKRKCDEELTTAVKTKKLIVITGVSRSGKSSLLNQVMLADNLKIDWIDCYMDLQGMGSSDSEFFMKNFFDEISYKLGRSISNWNELSKTLDNHPIVFRIDEFGWLEPDLAAEIISNFYKLTHAYKKEIRIIACMLYPIKEFLQNLKNENPNNTKMRLINNPKYSEVWHTITVELFRKEESDALLKNLPKDVASIAYEHLETIMKLSEGYPSKLQCLCYRLFETSQKTNAKDKLISVIENKASYNVQT